MHATLKAVVLRLACVLVLGAALGTVSPVAGSATRPAEAAPGDCHCVGLSCVTLGNGGTWANQSRCFRQQYDELNRYESGEPERCSEGNRADPTTFAYTGTVHWVLISEHVNSVVRDRLGADSGLAYNLVCVPDPQYAAAGIDIAPTIYDTRVFDAVTPENLAYFAMDGFFETLPAPQPVLSPSPVTLVNFDTWLRLANPTTGQHRSPTASVPGPEPGVGIEVYAVAEATSVEWDMGDGSAPFTCPLHEPAQPPVCNSYRYPRSTAGEPNETYYGTAAILWLGRYYVNDVLQPDELTIPQEDTFEIQVAEAQALNTRGDD